MKTEKEKIQNHFEQNEPRKNLPLFGGPRYEKKDFILDLHPHVQESNFISPCDIITIYTGPTCKGFTAFNSDKIIERELCHNTFGFVPKGSAVFSAQNSSLLGIELIAMSFSQELRFHLEEDIPNQQTPQDVIENIILGPGGDVLTGWIRNFMTNGFSGGSMLAESLLTMSLSLTLNKINKLNLPRIGPKLTDKKIKQIDEFIDANLNQDISLREMSEVVATSPYHFSRCFRSAVGTSPYAYLIKRRIDRVKKLLHGTNRQLSDIALSCGFSSLSHMSLQFKKHVGITPLRYRIEAHR